MTASTPAPPGIFISYRRKETAPYAGWLFDKLADHFGRDQIFKDVDSIQLGDNFAEDISDAVASCQVLLALIGDRWLTITDREGRRLDNPKDFVRLEIEAALSRDIRVIPILIDGAQMPRADQLPSSLAGLAGRQALELSANRFDSDVAQLLKVLDKTFRVKRASITGHVSNAATHQRLAGVSVRVLGAQPLPTPVTTQMAPELGQYTLTGVRPGAQTLRAEMSGFISKDIPVNVPSNGQVTQDIELTLVEEPDRTTPVARQVAPTTRADDWAICCSGAASVLPPTAWGHCKA